ncbi:putative -export membrane protein SecD [Mycobacterium ulcerans str. Harvey]|uniref:Putative-export membrane protein SecD n=1 Tax=Mycobacterium ulcerans str. Harvey TaxID=1299332 RepID=A0ABN0R8Y7_MYCUL|nr:putative -export membrane protein SecD [Mycobacterium ulcerans str. Harvey]
MHPARYLSVFLVLLIGVYLLVFLTGDKKAAPNWVLTCRAAPGSR